MFRAHRLQEKALKDILFYCQPELVLTGVSGTWLKSLDLTHNNGCSSLYDLQASFQTTWSVLT